MFMNGFVQRRSIPDMQAHRVCPRFVWIVLCLTLVSCRQKAAPADDNKHERHAPLAKSTAAHGHTEEIHAVGGDADKHDEHAGHKHDTKTNTQNNETARCEHGIAIIDCDECRYEVGAVLVDQQLCDTDNGLIASQAVHASSNVRRILANGEVAFDERRIVHVSPRLSGNAHRVFAELGDKVTAHARLFEIDSLELGRLRAELLNAQAQQRVAHKRLQREQLLFQKKITSEDDKIKAEAEHESARIAVDAAAEQLKLLGFDEKSLSQLGSTEDTHGGCMVVRAPIAGSVVAKHAVLGEMLTPSEPTFTIADLSKVWIWASIYERDLVALIEAKRGGQLTAKVRVGGIADHVFAGIVDYIGATMDEKTRTLRARVLVDNPDEILRPGMFVDVELLLGGSGIVVLAPADAVLVDEGKAFVFVRDQEQRFVRRNVRLGKMRQQQREILDGLKVGEVIATQGAFLLKSDILREKMGAGCAD